MKHYLLILIVLFAGCTCKRRQPDDLNLDPQGVVTTSPSSSSTTSASASASAEPAEPPPKPTEGDWAVLTDFDVLHGTWVHHEKGSSHPGEEIQPGGVKFIFSQNPDSLTPWNLRFWAPTEGHMTSDTISGGCGFYTTLHDDIWYTAYCKGYGLPTKKGVKLRITLELSSDGSKLKVRIKGLIDTTLKKL